MHEEKTSKMWCTISFKCNTQDVPYLGVSYQSVKLGKECGNSDVSRLAFTIIFSVIATRCHFPATLRRHCLYSVVCLDRFLAYCSFWVESGF